MNATDLAFLNHWFHSLAYRQRFIREKKLMCMVLNSYSGLLLSNIMLLWLSGRALHCVSSPKVVGSIPRKHIY